LCNWYPRDADSAKAIVYYNLSVAHAIRGEVDLAYRNFNRVLFLRMFEKLVKPFFTLHFSSKCVVQFGKLNLQPANTYFMKIYLDLIDGNRQNLQTLLYDFFRHVTVNSTYQALQNTPQVVSKSQAPAQQPSTTPINTTPTQSIPFLNSTQPSTQQPPQLQNINPSFLQSHPQLLQLAQQQQQQQQFFNQFNSPTNPFHPASFPASSAPSGVQQQQINAAAAAAAYQNLNNSAFNFTTQNVNQLLQQQQATPQFHSRIN
jgi:hypothetical protein